jgi:DNA primase
MVERYERVKLTNPDKVLYPATGTTKAEVFEYYVAIADAMVPHIAGRPVTRKRWPNGVGQPDFFEKQLASSAPDWLQRGHDHLPDHRHPRGTGVDCAAGVAGGPRAAVAVLPVR